MSSEPDAGGTGPGEPIDAVVAYVASFGVAARPVREVLAALTESPHTLDDLIVGSGLSRRTVEGLLACLGGDLDGDATGPTGAVLRTARVPAYRERFGYGQLGRTRLTDWAWSRRGELARIAGRLAGLVGEEPDPVSSLDHVSATPQTLARRALWLDGSYDLAGTRLLCVGDHDLTSLAVCLANTEVEVTVVDIDERVLEFVDTRARQLGLNVRTLYADLRFGLPPAVTGWADAAFTDPPYTPEGVGLFAVRALQGLRDGGAGRLMVAYGFGESQPALGHKVQRAMLELNLVFEAIVPGFNRYQGAQAVGSASELYVCRPTSRTWRALPRLVETAAANIYTRGPEAREAQGADAATEVFDAALAGAAGPREWPVNLVAGAARGPDEAAHVSLQRLLTAGVPGKVAHTDPLAAVVDLTADQGGWLLRALLAVNADRLAAVVPNNHPDLAAAASQRRLTELVRHKYTLRLRRSIPTPRHAIVEAERVDPDGLDDGARLVRWLLDRAHGTLGSVWRDGLIAVSRAVGELLTKNQARVLVREAARNQDALRARLIDLPRHQLRETLDNAAAQRRS